MRCTPGPAFCRNGSPFMRSLTLAQSGLLLLLAGSAVDSTSGLFTRLLPTDGFTTASGRGLAAFAFLFLVLAVRDGRGTLRALARDVNADGVVSVADVRA